MFQIVLEHCLSVCLEYVVEGLRICPQWLQADLLRALAALLYENVAHVVKVSDLLASINILSSVSWLFIFNSERACYWTF